MAVEPNDNLQTLVAQVAAAYFSNSHVGVSEIGAVIEQIARSLVSVGGPTAEVEQTDPEPSQERRLTAAQVRKSITPDALISFEDGKPYKTLRRHLSVKGLTPEQYRGKWGLPADYPMVSATYSQARSRMAKELGLGNLGGRRKAATAPPPRRRRTTAATP